MRQERREKRGKVISSLDISDRNVFSKGEQSHSNSSCFSYWKKTKIKQIFRSRQARKPAQDYHNTIKTQQRTLKY